MGLFVLVVVVFVCGLKSFTRALLLVVGLRSSWAFDVPDLVPIIVYLVLGLGF